MTRHSFAAIPPGERYTLRNATLPLTLLAGASAAAGDGLGLYDLTVDRGMVAAITPASGGHADIPALDLDRGMVFPGFVDIHTHLDKGHIWPRRPNPDGTFQGALATVHGDREANWSAADLRARMEFGLKCAFAHGTVAIRTHIDSIDQQTGISWPVFEELRTAWAGRIVLEAVPLFGIEQALDEAHLAAVVAAMKGRSTVLGTVTYPIPQLREGLDRVFRLALDHGFALDFHVDETLDPGVHTLAAIADAALRHRFTAPILVGHCCSLSVHSDEEAARTLARVAEAGIAVVSLPLCNLYLQDRVGGRTPRRRGVTLLHEMAARGIPTMVASDNTRDPFYAYGDLDMLEVYRAATRILHLDHPVGDWPRAVTARPAAQMGLAEAGMLRAGAPADLVLFRARTWTELLSRPQSDRTVLRRGAPIDTTLPDYRELDAVVGG